MYLGNRAQTGIGLLQMTQSLVLAGADSTASAAMPFGIRSWVEADLVVTCNTDAGAPFGLNQDVVIAILAMNASGNEANQVTLYSHTLTPANTPILGWRRLKITPADFLVAAVPAAGWTLGLALIHTAALAPVDGTVTATLTLAAGALEQGFDGR